eukprot:TRINITY_DN8487_c0_g1_i1.p1 TRINITY_DN8487_c0_g1~~TRINITY_DN8487_c0_g1_i1.p1  ORF type:complete len:507 (-),score=124.49 TRINITY_DN8487_c0_g1_i1:26-1546(-)
MGQPSDLGILPLDCYREILRFIPIPLRTPLLFVCKKFNAICTEINTEQSNNPDIQYLSAKEFMDAAAEEGSIELLNWASQNGCRMSKSIFGSAAKSKKIQVLDWVLKETERLGIERSYFLYDLVWENAVVDGSMDCLQWMQREYPKFYKYFDPQTPIPLGAFLKAQILGQVDVLVWMMDNSPTFKIFSRCGINLSFPNVIPNVRMLRFELECIGSNPRKPIYIIGANMEVLQEALNSGLKWGKTTVELAAKDGDLETLLFVLKHNEETLEDSDQVRICRAAAEGGKVENLKHLRSLNYKWDHETMDFAARRENNLPMLKYLFENGCPHYEELLSSLGRRGLLEEAKYAKEQGIPFTRFTATDAIRSGNLEFVKWLVDNKCEINPNRCWDEAAGEGYLSILKYLKEKNILPGPTHDHSGGACEKAAAGGYFRVLQFLRENGLIWGSSVWTYAARGGYINILTYAKDHQCPNKYTRRSLEDSCHRRVREWTLSGKAKFKKEGKKCTIS